MTQGSEYATLGLVIQSLRDIVIFVSDIFRGMSSLRQTSFGTYTVAKNIQGLLYRSIIDLITSKSTSTFISRIFLCFSPNILTGEGAGPTAWINANLLNFAD